MNIKVGQKVSSTKKYTKNLVQLFSNVTGDNNPLHLDENYAKKTIFKKPIVHGMFVASQISELIANKLPGPGSIYIGQNLQFKQPVYIDDEVTCTISVKEIIKEKSNIVLETTCSNQNSKEVISGTAFVKFQIY